VRGAGSCARCALVSKTVQYRIVLCSTVHVRGTGWDSQLGIAELRDFITAERLWHLLCCRYTEPLTLKQVLDVPNISDHKDRFGRLLLPNHLFGSDHFSLVSEFHFPDAKKVPP